MKFDLKNMIWELKVYKNVFFNSSQNIWNWRIFAWEYNLFGKVNIVYVYVTLLELPSV